MSTPHRVQVQPDSTGAKIATYQYVDGGGVVVDAQAVVIVDSTSGNQLGLALDGTDATGVTAPSGASGIRGWLSSIYNALLGVLFVSKTPYKVTLVTTATASTCLGPTGAAAKYLVGIINYASTAQTATLSTFDNASTASGTQGPLIGQLAASQVIMFPEPGIPLINGMTVLASATPTGGGIGVCVR